MKKIIKTLVRSLAVLWIFDKIYFSCHKKKIEKFKFQSSEKNVFV